MRLTNAIRESIINAVMADVPSIDYVEQIRSAVNVETKRLLKDAGIENARPERLYETYTRIGGNNYACRGLLYDERIVLQNTPALLAIADTDKKQASERNVLRHSLKTAFSVCYTRKQLLETFPEFEKYLPEGTPTSANRQLPVACNVFADLVKAGWPKDKQRVSKFANTTGATP